MKFNLFNKKKEFVLSSIQSSTVHTDGSVSVTRIIPAKVIEVGDDEAEDGFSYKYSFINPSTNKMESATDSLQHISVGEQLFEVGDDVNILLTENSKDGSMSVTRQLVFPDILRRKENIRKIIKVVYFVGIFVVSAICCFSAYYNPSLFQK